MIIRDKKADLVVDIMNGVIQIFQLKEQFCKPMIYLSSIF